VAEAQRVARQKRAAHELALQQQQIEETQRRQYEAYQIVCARRHAYEQWLAQQQTAQPDRRAAKRQRRQQQVQQQQVNPVHQDGGVIMDTPR